MNFKILGPLEAESDGEPIDLGPKKQRSLFGLLLVNYNRVVTTDRILEELWGDDAEGKENALWVYISRLRSILDAHSVAPALVTKDHGYSVEIEPDALDSYRFEQLASRGAALSQSDPQAAADTLREALALWRGSPLEEFTYDDWAQPHVARLTELRNQCVGDRIDADLKRGVSGELIGELEHLVDERPLDERPVSQLMLAQYRAGRQAAALRAFERFRRRAGEELGIDPSPELRRLEEQILLHDTRLQPRTDTPSSARRPVGSNPFKGLEAFKEHDADLFFGRDTLVAEILARIADHSVVSIVGPSGSGKSSAVRSGVIPALRKNAIDGSDMWVIASMTPGSHPFVELEATLLRSSFDPPDSLREQLDGSSDEMLRAVFRLSPADDTTVVIVIDQFEELFTMSDPTTADRFLTALSEAADDPRSRIRIVVTLRADFYERPLSHAAFGSAMSRGVVNVVPMAPEELEQAASQPATHAGVRLEPGLEAALIGDVLGQPGALPLFQFALTDLFDRRVGDTLTLASYRDIGGVDGSVGRKAEQIYENLTSVQQSAAQQIFLRLVSITDTETRSRRRVEASELLDLDLEVTDVQTVIDMFGRERLLSFDRNNITGSPTVEVAHEALLDHWNRLAEWIELGSEDIRMYGRLTTSATEWDEAGCDAGYLLSGGRLERFAEWDGVSTLTPGRTEREYLDLSLQARDQLKSKEDARIAREAHSARRAKRNAWALVALVVTVLAASSFFIWSALQPEGPTVALVRIPESENGIDGLILAGFQRGEQELAIETRDVIVLADAEQIMRELAEQGTDVIIAGLRFEYAAEQVAADYPNTQFIVPSGISLPSGLANVSRAEFESGSGTYLVGAAAGFTTKTGTIGMMGGVQNDYMEEFAAGYEAGATEANGAVEVLVGWASERAEASGWEDPELGYEAAMSMYEQGADIIFIAAGGAGIGAMRAASDFSERTGSHVWTIGVDQDEGLLVEEGLQDYVLTSIVNRSDVAVFGGIEAYLSNTLEPLMTYGFANGGISYSTQGGYLDDIRGQLESVRDRLRRGEIDPPIVTTTASVWRNTVDHVVEVTYDGAACSLSRTPLAEDGDTVAFILTNRSDTVAGFWFGNLLEPTTQADLNSLTFDVRFDVGFLYHEFGHGWSVPPGETYELRAALRADREGGVLACWPGSGFDAGPDPSFTEIIPVGSG